MKNAQRTADTPALFHNILPCKHLHDNVTFTSRIQVERLFMIALIGKRMKQGGEEKIRLKDVAMLCKTSVAVVSQVLNGGHGTIGVSEAKAALVRRTAERLHYQPNLLARSLVGRKSRLVGAFIDSMAPPFCQRVLSSLFFRLQADGYHLLISEGHDSVQQLREAYAAFQQYGIAGMVVLSHNYGLTEALDFLDLSKTVFLGKPDVSVGRENVVDVDFATAYGVGVQHLCRLGRRRIGLLLPKLVSRTLHQRKEGFKRAAEELGSQIETALIDERGGLELTQERLEAQLAFVIKHKLDGLLMLNDIHAVAFCRCCDQHHLDVPGDIAVIGEGDHEFSSFARPSLTTLYTDFVSCGNKLAEMMFRLQEGQDAPLLDVLTPTLVIRESTGIGKK